MKTILKIEQFKFCQVFEKEIYIYKINFLKKHFLFPKFFFLAAKVSLLLSFQPIYFIVFKFTICREREGFLKKQQIS